MMLPQNLSASEPINLITLTLSPKDETGLVSLNCDAMFGCVTMATYVFIMQGVSIQRTRQGNLFVSEVIEGVRVILL